MLLEQFSQQLQRHAPNQKQFLIGFSGGLDSTALLALFAKHRENRPHFRLRAIHIHHGLSPNADVWAAHCQQICRHLNIPLLIQPVKVRLQNGIEAGAREARYEAITQHILPEEWLATAHHQQDQTETFLLALKRGSGLQGLGAMQVNSTVYGVPIFRPLLNFSRQQLMAFVQQQRLTWVEDESNEDNQYDRNFLRNVVLPEFRQRWAHFDSAVQRSAQHCYEQQQLLNELLAEEYQKNIVENDRTFKVHDFATYSPAKQRALLRLWLQEQGVAMPSLVQLEHMIADVIFAKADAQPQFRLEDKILRRYQNKLFLTPIFADISQVCFEAEFHQPMNLPDGLGSLLLQKTPEKMTALWRDENGQEYKETLGLPLAGTKVWIRFGYSGKVKLTQQGVNQDIKKIWQGLNVPPWQRQRIPLIFYGDELQSAVGFFRVFQH
ncbi:tRNA lysidine(34) synthetase TilS [Aggregatibacter actinomycetemcomitans]|uniref:tRNA lysidine(34) synthetase TilS n=1 Tax=Aggregatibacter actinomycetemcomitans TaxID=714 RepID=UPI0002400A6B|nr:tRNA lysidine(34) synthetase TilS [Aggregatibacter actinomycetemcomitans]EHK89784.1 tRNA(Ile)-lysidine synthase [Aggregatibacter actinomycetemcomitans RhAA1]